MRCQVWSIPRVHGSVDAKRLRRAATALAVAGLLTAPPARALAQASCVPGQTVAALDQYCDALPTSDGTQVPASNLGSTDSGPKLGTVLTPKEVAQLSDAGPAARALLVLPAVSPLVRGATVAQRRRIAQTGRKIVRSGALDDSKGDVGRVVASSLSSAGGAVVGGAFRWGLVACTMAFAGMAWLRFRTRLKL
jgi:hypothetical protein